MHNKSLNNFSGLNRNRLMYFQPEVDCYSREANKNKCKHVQLIASKKKKKLKDSCRFLCCLDFKVFCCLGLLLLESIFIELESILLLESYVCFSIIQVALYLYQYDTCK